MSDVPFMPLRPVSSRTHTWRREAEQRRLPYSSRIACIVSYAKQHVARLAFDDHRARLHPIREITQRPRVRQHLRIEDREDVPVAARRPAEEAGMAVVVHAGAAEQLASPMGDGLVDAGLQRVRTVPDAERAVGVAARGPVLEGKADRLIEDRLFEGAVIDRSRGAVGGWFGGELEGDRGLPALWVGREVGVKVLRLAQ